MIDLLGIATSFLMRQGILEDWALLIAVSAILTLVTLCSWLVNLIFKRLILVWIKQLIKKTEMQWDDLLVKWRVLDKLVTAAPVITFYLLSSAFLIGSPALLNLIVNLAAIIIIVIGVNVIDAALDFVLDLYSHWKIAQSFPIKSFIQVAKVLSYLVGIIMVIAIFADKSPVYILSGMGALTAVLMLIFKDPILGLVAGIQLTRNNMIQIGDWIEMPKYQADGDVIDLGLTTVKVKNWDNTVTTIPTYALISDSFKNWRYMSDSGGRRIKRAFKIDLNSVRFCTEEMLQRFSKVQYIAEYIADKQQEILKYNEERKVDLQSLANGRRMTNLGVLRAYTEAYLRNHPMISKELTLMVRQLEPTEHGLPVEIYCFSADKRWVYYEKIQSDIFDHLIAVVPIFDLRLFQRPSGRDFTEQRQPDRA
ncbi:MAG: mechanosensitive ion channel domain-containing protein [Kiritimatiellia bacterium]